MLGGEVLRHLLQVVVREELEEIVHRRILPPPRLEGVELVVQIARRLAAQAWKIGIVSAPALDPVAGRACLDAVGHGAVDVLARSNGGASHACN